MIRKSVPSGYDLMGGYRLSEKVMLKQRDRVRATSRREAIRDRKTSCKNATEIPDEVNADDLSGISKTYFP